MADGQAAAIAAAFPNPPPYSKHFTKDNLVRLQEVKDAPSTGEDDRSNTLDAAALTGDLQYLVPPEPPADGKYQCFGVQHDLNQPDISLEAAGITQIYPSASASVDPTPKLIALTRAILLNFLELLGIMSNNPEDTTDKVEDLQTLFYNAHDLINQYRPHQARESLILMMEEQLARSRAEIAAVNDGKVKLQELLQGVKQTGDAQTQQNGTSHDMEVDGEQHADPATLKRQAQQRALWDMLDAELG